MKIKYKNGVVSSVSAWVFDIALLLQNNEVVGVNNPIKTVDLLYSNKSSLSNTFLTLRKLSAELCSKIRKADEININLRKLALDGYLNTSLSSLLKEEII